MAKKIPVISGSPKKDGNTATLVEWLTKGARSKGAEVEIVKVAFLKYKSIKWDNKAGTMKTPLKGKTLVLIASAFEDIGLDALEKPFALTASYTGMKFKSLLIPNAGESGDIKNKTDIKKKTIALGKKAAE